MVNVAVDGDGGDLEDAGTHGTEHGQWGGHIRRVSGFLFRVTNALLRRHHQDDLLFVSPPFGFENPAQSWGTR